jgi:metallo-beta-lactamase family protein
MTIQFIGAAREVTGSKHLITTAEGKKILLDCGMFQGKGSETDSMNRDLGFDPESIDYLILSHAHIDHSGLIPYLYKNGFRGSVLCTAATRDLCAIMLKDSAFIQELDTKWYNKKVAKMPHESRPPFAAPIFNVAHAEACMELFITVAVNRRFYINDKINVKFTDTGHMLGSAAVNLEILENGSKKHICYTGDIGRAKNRILTGWQRFPQCDYLISESTYGNRLHESGDQMEEKLLKIVNETCVQKKGKLIIPSFSVGRTQEIVYILNKFNNEHRLPKIPVFVDSPLSVNATEIFRLHSNLLNEDVKQTMQNDSNPFGFNSLHYISKLEESKKLNRLRKPCIIISASGMAEAGRVKHHIFNSIENPRNTILMVGYCAPVTLGARLQTAGLREISIFGTPCKVRARIERIESLSGHADYDEMIEYLSCQDKSRIKKLFLVHGEYEIQKSYSAHLTKAGFRKIEIPAAGEKFEL